MRKLLHKLRCLLGMHAWEDWVRVGKDYENFHMSACSSICPHCGKAEAYLVVDEGLPTEGYGGLDEMATESLNRLVTELRYTAPESRPLTVPQIKDKGRFIAVQIVDLALNETLTSHIGPTP